jgi:hypothetical protein
MNKLGGDDSGHDLPGDAKDRLEKKLREDPADFGAKGTRRKPAARSLRRLRSLGANRSAGIRKVIDR